MTADLIGDKYLTFSCHVWGVGVISQLYLEQIWTAPDTGIQMPTQMPVYLLYIHVPNYQYAPPPPRPQCLKVSSPVIALCVSSWLYSSNMHPPVAEFRVPDWGG
jgi:hypothetical protein